MMYACYAGGRRVLRTLKSCGAEIDNSNYVDETPLIKATWTLNLPAMQWLIRHGADVNAQESAVHSLCLFLIG
jgi:hypothetical protein